MNQEDAKTRQWSRTFTWKMYWFCLNFVPRDPACNRGAGKFQVSCVHRKNLPKESVRKSTGERCRSTRTNKAPISKASKAAPRTCHGCTRRGTWRSRGIRTTVLRTPLPGKRVPHPRLSARRRSLSKLHWTGPHVLLPSNRRHDAPRAKFDREGTRMRINMLENSLGLLRQRGLCKVRCACGEVLCGEVYGQYSVITSNL